MSYLPKLNAKIGGGLGGLPERKINKVGSKNYLIAGTFTFTIPDGVTSISAVCIGGGGGGGGYNAYCAGGGGGGLAYKNNIPVQPNTIITIVVGAGGVSTGNGGNSSISINGNVVVSGFGGTAGSASDGVGGSGIGDTVFKGGNGVSNSHGGGAGGYYSDGALLSAGDCTGITGDEAILPGNGGTWYTGGGGHGLSYGGGGGSDYNNGVAQNGASGAVRIIFGPNRSFPKTNCNTAFN